MHRFVIPALGVLCAGLIATVTVTAGEKETPDNSRPSVLLVTFRADGSKDCAKLETTVNTVRTSYADKNALFLTCDLTSRGSRHQAKLVLNYVGAEDVWIEHGRTHGRLLLLDALTGDVLKTFTAADSVATVSAAVHKALERDDPEEDEGCGDMEDDDGGEDDDG